jgi:RecG-like helicase
MPRLTTRCNETDFRLIACSRPESRVVILTGSGKTIIYMVATLPPCAESDLKALVNFTEVLADF